MVSRSAPRWATAVALACLAALVVLLAGRLALATLHLPLDYNEGWNAFQARSFMRHGNPYPPAGGLIANNYPPLSFVLVGLAGGLTGDFILAGRVVALVALLAVAALIALIVRRLAPQDRFAPWLGSGLFLGFNLTLFRAYVGIDDPQWLGHGFMVAGLALVLWREEPGPLPLPRALGSALLLAAGGLVKHNLLAVPLAAGLWLLLNDRRTLAVWAGVALVAAVGVLSLDQAAFGGAMLANILQFPRGYYLKRMLLHGLLAIPLLPMLAVSLRLLPRSGAACGADRRDSLLAWGCLIALALGFVQGSGAGVDVNAWFDALIFLSLATPVALVRGRAPLLGRSPLVWLALPLVLALPYGLYTMAGELAWRRSARPDTRALIERIAQIPGPVGCQILALCYWAGKDFEVDFLLADQRVEQGKTAVLLPPLDQRKLAAVVVEGPAEAPLSPMGELVAARYRMGFANAEYRIYYAH